MIHPMISTTPHSAATVRKGRSSASIAAATASNPESDSFSYIETLLEAFAVLGKLGIFTLDEVEERAEYGRSRSTSTSKAAWKVSNLRLVALESSAKQVDHEVLKDFFWTTYSMP
ncbi:Sec8 exocyst complex component specific domain-containing protein [Mycena indigotica]|uniref:Sec8 exocyst complex component specific domain-containing protein n=1 Tax=Mycena indigotica TaxID=2126181 RepID=A0A8H6T6P2_9AGAR|nr:Sec8 exocyst complex component specific domain-containing protein [Mycena indigotica]KAF7312778.1 Sec8 exocyst complex component specific domain-containing protein [Mycena indigotica]